MTRRPIALLASAGLMVGLVAGGATSTAPAHAATSTSAKTLLSGLAVKSEVRVGYVRSKFQQGDETWIDADKDGCNTRKEVLIQEATKLTRVSASCAVYGTWTSPYDGKKYTDPYNLEVDHLVAVAEAWQSGAHAWSQARRVKFANDLGYSHTLKAVTKSVNQGKSAQQPNDWLPSRTSYRCTYIKAWIGVKYRWGLAVDSQEKAALSSSLNRYCDSMTMTKPSKA